MGAAGEAVLAVGENRVFDDRIADPENLIVGAEAEVVVLLLGRGVDPAALVPAERALLVVARDDVLPQLGPNLFEQVPSVSEEGEVAQQCVLALEEVPCGDDPQRRGGCGGDGRTTLLMPSVFPLQPRPETDSRHTRMGMLGDRGGRSATLVRVAVAEGGRPPRRE